MTGVPYAFVDVVNGQTVRVCPVCGRRVAEETDQAGEITSDNYGEHFVGVHGAPPGGPPA